MHCRVVHRPHPILVGLEQLLLRPPSEGVYVADDRVEVRRGGVLLRPYRQRPGAGVGGGVPPARRQEYHLPRPLPAVPHVWLLQELRLRPVLHRLDGQPLVVRKDIPLLDPGEACSPGGAMPVEGDAERLLPAGDEWLAREVLYGLGYAIRADDPAEAVGADLAVVENVWHGLRAGVVQLVHPRAHRRSFFPRNGLVERLGLNFGRDEEGHVPEGVLERFF
mmetsp:Transcript_5205/g.14721  ORF Transcript_5205/g.14721 Transcript_5205/m.14721 type:complete len:221 (-) Transcript_5205:36-698(-)